MSKSQAVTCLWFPYLAKPLQNLILSWMANDPSLISHFQNACKNWNDFAETKKFLQALDRFATYPQVPDDQWLYTLNHRTAEVFALDLNLHKFHSLHKISIIPEFEKLVPIASDEGLVLMYYEKSGRLPVFYIHNPLTKTFKKLPDPNIRLGPGEKNRMVGLIAEKDTKKFFVVVVGSQHSGGKQVGSFGEVQIYRSATDSWAVEKFNVKDMDIGGCICFSVRRNGCLYWCYWQGSELRMNWVLCYKLPKVDVPGNREFDRTPWSSIHAPMPAVWKNDMHESALVEAEGNIFCIAEITEGFSSSITVWKLIHEDHADKTQGAWHTATVMPVQMYDQMMKHQMDGDMLAVTGAKNYVIIARYPIWTRGRHRIAMRYNFITAMWEVLPNEALNEGLQFGMSFEPRLTADLYLIT